MKWYLASMAMLFVLVGSGLLTGSLLLVLLPARMQPACRVFLSVPLGWALLTLVATPLGWFGHGYAVCHCLLLTAALSAAGAWTGRRWLRRAGGECVRLAAFCSLASFPFLAPLLRHGSFAMYNDTFLYISQAQWLQHHGFLAPAHTGGGHPAWGAVISFQGAHLRMGSSFLLAWAQAMFNLAWSVDAYPAVSAFGVICGALGVGATVLAACPGRWPEAWLAALAAACTVNGFAFGAASGFLPQTWGLAFASAAFGLRGIEMSAHAERSRRGAWRTGLPLGLCAAASMHCYWDLLPLEGPALACTYLWPWPGRDSHQWRSAWRQAWSPALTCLLLVNAEWIRAVKGILNNLTMVVANPVNWQVWEFPLHALGLKSSVWDGSRWIAAAPLSLWLGCLPLVVWLAVMAGSQFPARWRHWLRNPARLARWHGGAVTPAAVWVLLTTGLFIRFRYFVRSPWHDHPDPAWPDGVGQSWSQYKLTIWASFAFITVVAAAVVGVAAWTRSRLARWAVVLVLTAWFGAGLGWNYLIAGRRGRNLLVDTGAHVDPLVACLAVRQMVDDLPVGEWIYLDWPADGSRRKFRELLVYYLCDHPLVSDWSDDGYIAPYTTPEDVRRTRHDCQWVLKCRPPTPPDNNDVPALGGMTLERAR